MTKISVVHYKKLVKFFEANGFRYVRTRGDHLVYVKAGIKRPIIIPKYREVPVFVIKENLKTASIDRIKYLKFFKIVY